MNIQTVLFEQIIGLLNGNFSDFPLSTEQDPEADTISAHMLKVNALSEYLDGGGVYSLPIQLLGKSTDTIVMADELLSICKFLQNMTSYPNIGDDGSIIKCYLKDTPAFADKETYGEGVQSAVVEILYYTKGDSQND